MPPFYRCLSMSPSPCSCPEKEAELKSATNNFSSDSIISESSEKAPNVVYEGRLVNLIDCNLQDPPLRIPRHTQSYHARIHLRQREHDRRPLGLSQGPVRSDGLELFDASDNSKAYQNFSADRADANRDDLIMWPPSVLVLNTITGQGRDGRMEGIGNKAMDSFLRAAG